MPLPRPWTVVETEHLHNCRVFQVRRTLARSPNTGQVHPFFRIDSDEWVNVVALTCDREVVMVRQWRHGSGTLSLEIPGGLVDPGEPPAGAALRELQEETGYGAGAVVPIGVLNPNPALFGNRVHTFLARDVVRLGEVENEGLEETAVELIPVAEVEDRIRAGAIDHALVIAGLYWFALAEGRERR